MNIMMQVLDAMPQDIAIRSTGNDVALLRPLGEMGEEAPLDALPDPIDLFVRAVNEQMFTLGQETACDSSARVDQRSYDETERTARWVVHIDHAHPACLRVLYNLLSPRDFESVEVRGTMPAPEPSTTVSTSGAMPLDVARVPYPPVLQELPFEVEYEEGNRALRDRLLQVEFRTPPEDEVVDRLSDVITFWCDLLLLGGYPPEDMAPREAGVMAEGPLLFDEYTVQVAFPELFHADDKAFDAMLNHLSCLTDRGIKKACIR